MARLPDAVTRLFWDVEPASVDLGRHRDYVMERVMVRGNWEAMQWLLATYDAAILRAFVEGRGRRVLPPDALAFWALMSDAKVPIPTGGARPRWAGE